MRTSFNSASCLSFTLGSSYWLPHIRHYSASFSYSQPFLLCLLFIISSLDLFPASNCSFLLSFFFACLDHTVVGFVFSNLVLFIQHLLQHQLSLDFSEEREKNPALRRTSCWKPEKKEKRRRGRRISYKPVVVGLQSAMLVGERRAAAFGEILISYCLGFQTFVFGLFLNCLHWSSRHSTRVGWVMTQYDLGNMCSVFHSVLPVVMSLFLKINAVASFSSQ